MKYILLFIVWILCIGAVPLQEDTGIEDDLVSKKEVYDYFDEMEKKLYKLENVDMPQMIWNRMDELLVKHGATKSEIKKEKD